MHDALSLTAHFFCTWCLPILHVYGECITFRSSVFFLGLFDDALSTP